MVLTSSGSDRYIVKVIGPKRLNRYLEKQYLKHVRTNDKNNSWSFALNKKDYKELTLEVTWPRVNQFFDSVKAIKR